jgi:acetyl/propionyl-CoA carboxylase alpha subunit
MGILIESPRDTEAVRDRHAVMIKRLLIANRGEIAVRIIAACRELGIESVAAYSDADATAAHVRAADGAVRLGPAVPAESYLSIQAVLNAAREAGAQAIHPGYGFLSENAAFASACEQAGLLFVGPPSRVIARIGAKIEARRIARGAGVAVVPGETPADQSDDGLMEAVKRVGLPAVIKASAGGGGRGMRHARMAADVPDAVRAARDEALAAFGDGRLYVERLLLGAHHVEVQVFADAHGRVAHLFERECSVQRRHQKVIEESPSPSIGRSLRERITRDAVRVAVAAEYRNAGTVEFLVDRSERAGDDAPFYFLEMNTRLQVEHPITEEIVGVDLVRAQLLVAAGEPLPWTQGELTQRGHAIEARVYAEDPSKGLLPQAGRILLHRAPRMPGVRVDAGVSEGDAVPLQFDALLSKVIASAETRDLAIDRLAVALRSYPILGVQTNIPFLLRILEHPRFRAGELDTGFLDGEGASLALVQPGPPPEPVLAAVRAHRGRDAFAFGHEDQSVQWDPWIRLRNWRGWPAS